jgi:hypothetical protein
VSALVNCGCFVVCRDFEQKGAKVTKDMRCASGACENFGQRTCVGPLTLFEVKTKDWKVVCGRSAGKVRRGERSKAIGSSYPITEGGRLAVEDARWGTSRTRKMGRSRSKTLVRAPVPPKKMPPRGRGRLAVEDACCGTSRTWKKGRSRSKTLVRAPVPPKKMPPRGPGRSSRVSRTRQKGRSRSKTLVGAPVPPKKMPPRGRGLLVVGPVGHGGRAACGRGGLGGRCGLERDGLSWGRSGLGWVVELT